MADCQKMAVDFFTQNVYLTSSFFRYRKKGVGLMLTQTAQKWCRQNRIDAMELVITECQEEARQIFNTAG